MYKLCPRIGAFVLLVLSKQYLVPARDCPAEVSKPEAFLPIQLGSCCRAKLTSKPETLYSIQMSESKACITVSHRCSVTHVNHVKVSPEAIFVRTPTQTGKQRLQTAKLQAAMACNVVPGSLRAGGRPHTRTPSAHNITCYRRHRRRLVPVAAAAVDAQRTPVKVNQLLIATDEQRLVTTEQPISFNPEEFGPAKFSEQSTPYDAEQDWHERFGHYGRYSSRSPLCFGDANDLC